MKCPHCEVYFHDNVVESRIGWNGNYTNVDMMSLKCSSCKKYIVLARHDSDAFEFVYPKVTLRGAVPFQVPNEIARDYNEAAAVLNISPKASAALSRRCLQSILNAAGYNSSNLFKQVSDFINESDPKRVAPQSVIDTVDAIRNFGNFSAHPIDDKSTLQIVDVDPQEAEWCLDILDELFEHFYVRPAIALAKKAQLDAKLAAAGKPPSQ